MRVFSNSSKKRTSDIGLDIYQSLGLDVKIPPKVFTEKDYTIFYQGGDTVKLNIEHYKYSKLFSSGLLMKKVYFDYGSAFRIDDIQEISKENKNSKVHRYKLTGSMSMYDGEKMLSKIREHIYVEIRTKVAFKGQDFENLLDESKITFWLKILIIDPH